MAFRITQPLNTYYFNEYIKPINMPSGTRAAIDNYHELARQLVLAYGWITKFGGDGQSHSSTNVVVNTASNKSEANSFIDEIKVKSLEYLNGSCVSNGCGTPNHWSYSIIPDSPFLGACNQHDVCYCSGQSKGFCDQQFFHNMRLETEKIMRNLNGGAYHPAKKVEGVLFAKALLSQADAYYWAVSTLPAAKKAFCDASGDSNAIECRPAPSGAVEDKYKESSTGTYVNNGRVVTYRCTTYDVYTKQTGEYSGSYTVCSFA